MPIAINGSGTLTGLSVGGLENGIITPAELSTGAPSWDAQYNLTNVASVNNGALAGMRNRIVNGSMTVAQRGTSFPALANPVSTYTLDRWQWAQNGAMVCTVSVSSDVPNDTFINSLQADVTTADTSIAAGSYALITQRLEGVNVRDLIGTTFTLSFWVKSPKTGIHCIGFRNIGSGIPNRSYVKEYTVTMANAWEYKTITVAGGLITAGTWNWTNGPGLSVDFTLVTSTEYQTTAGAWQTGNFIGTSNQVNCMDNTANDFFITGVQLEPGPVATPFERRPIGTELALCQRYFQILPAMQGAMDATNSTLCVTPIFQVALRGAPTYVLRSGTNNAHYPGSVFRNITAVTGNINTLNATLDVAFGANIPGQIFAGAVTASAEL